MQNMDERSLKLINGIGKELPKLEYKNFQDWLIAYIPLSDLWHIHKSYVLCEAIFIIGGILILIHAFKQGGRWPWLYIATLFHSLTVELMAYFFPHIDNFWHAQGVFTLFERRMPLYILFLYIVYYYHSSWAMSKLKLKSQIAEHLAVGLMTVLIDMPYDIVSIKYVHWVWHDTDPNIEDRHYWVPWNSYYFHACFSASFQFWFHTTRKWLDKRDLKKWERGTIKSEIVSVIAAGLLGMPGGCLLFIPFYHPLHDFYKVPSEVTSISLLIAFTAIVWKFDRISNRYVKPIKLNWISKALLLHLICHYAVWLFIIIFLNPEDMISIGVHEVIGNCNETVPVETILKTLSKKKYLCASNYDEQYYDFHCLPSGKPPSDGSYWYTICGNVFENRVEYITVISLVTFVAFMVFKSFHFDYDANLINHLSPAERSKLEKAAEASTLGDKKRKLKTK